MQSEQNIRAFLRMESYLLKLKQDLRLNHKKLKQETVAQVASSLMRHQNLIRSQKRHMVELQAKKKLIENKKESLIEQNRIKQRVKHLREQREASQMIGRKNIRVKTQVSATCEMKEAVKYPNGETQSEVKTAVIDNPQSILEACPNLKRFEHALKQYSSSLIIEEGQSKKGMSPSGKVAGKRVKTMCQKELDHYNKDVELYICGHQKRKEKINIKVDWVKGNIKQIKTIRDKEMEPREKILLLEQLKLGYEEKYKSGKKEALDLICQANIAKADIMLNQL